MELMHHYSNVVSKEALLTGEGIATIWREYIPQEGLKHGFLMHGLLAFSALNLADLNRHSPEAMARYLSVCDKHQAIAIAALRDALNGNVTAENSGALFALAAVTSISSMARSCAMANARPGPHALTIDEIAEYVLLTRGVREVTTLTYGHVLHTPISVMFRFNAVEDTEAAALPLSAPVQSHFSTLHSMLDEYHASTTTSSDGGSNEKTLAYCRAALSTLESTYLNLRYWNSHGGVESGHIWRWPATLETGFTHLIAARYPPALVLVAHFGAATTPLRKAWYLRDWGTYAFAGISMALDGNDIIKWMEWPREQMKSNMSIVLD
ncbi:hypothetical protein LTR56_023197 [Elasticomyces elasticus]|nr:hypothetical protein LTR56_023197 [Elasticomyces elasticus]KAK3622842.1 hypothetical protein LTR22_024630 [Elasticomyces elasticus]KAK4900763.1 hypothetical protein LTR49_027383 [Elasticomyces elasticus]KAK5732932.1 hypothetical protein LTS12_027035 [Elasticomyces elasticus]